MNHSTGTTNYPDPGLLAPFSVHPPGSGCLREASIPECMHYRSVRNLRMNEGFDSLMIAPLDLGPLRDLLERDKWTSICPYRLGHEVDGTEATLVLAMGRGP
ncbi:hypothetical protein CONLIGDRAFT_687656 [Coniochaeta ligniaria NRRL 30616]|uniref:Uncharacterized protein n=1 Tax=Coniochaeta ligniaria NRRL 30616 TaxID=1408157 RepID=A0A1J7I472_9PEZI|nr:hypothetical protein CONLIGDRAFT_687656 [Coniochaeta ligniaria NRRL 30616]